MFNTVYQFPLLSNEKPQLNNFYYCSRSQPASDSAGYIIFTPHFRHHYLSDYMIATTKMTIVIPPNICFIFPLHRRLTSFSFDQTQTTQHDPCSSQHTWSRSHKAFVSFWLHG